MIIWFTCGGVQLTTSPIARGYQKLCGALALFAFVAHDSDIYISEEYLAYDQLKNTICPFHSSKMKSNSEKIAYNLGYCLWESTAGYSKARTMRSWVGL